MAKLLSVTECAARHGVSRATIHAAIKRGILAADRIGRMWVISEEACAAYQPERAPQARGARGAAVRWGGRPSEADSGNREHQDKQPGS